MIRVSVVGAKGRMGSHVVEAVNNAEDTQLALALDAGDDLTRVTTENTDVVVEFTVPSVSLNNVLTLIGQGVDVVVGTTGWTDEKLAKVKSAIANGPKPETQKVFIAPNFAISAVLADTLQPRPRNTSNPPKSSNCTTPPRWTPPPALPSTPPTASPKRARRPASPPCRTPPKPMAALAARWSTASTCTPCVCAASTPTRKCCFGNAGEQLTIRADSFDRTSFMPGVLLAVRKLAGELLPA